MTADGQIRNCLFARDEDDLRAILRDPQRNPDDITADVAAVIVRSVSRKAAGHGIDSPTFLQPDRPMSAIGG